MEDWYKMRGKQKQNGNLISLSSVTNSGGYANFQIIYKQRRVLIMKQLSMEIFFPPQVPCWQHIPQLP